MSNLLLLTVDETFQTFYVPIIRHKVASEVPFEDMVKWAKNLKIGEWRRGKRI